MRAISSLLSALPLLLLLLLLLKPVTTQYGQMLFGPQLPCQCVHARFCPTQLTTTSPAFCGGSGRVCCQDSAATSAPAAAAAPAAVGRPCGWPSGPGSGPVWVVAVTRRDQDGLLYRCAGALLSSTLVITVAHSVSRVPVEELVVVANMHDLLGHLGQEIFRRVSAVIIHPKYYPGDQHHDLAILRLERPLESGPVPLLTPVCLPQRRAQSDVEDSCWASGWGRDVLSHDATTAPLVDVPVNFASTSECLTSLATEDQHIDLSSDVCLRTGHSGGDLCKLDPGSPVVCPAVDGSATLVGLVSWARRCAGWHRSPVVVAAGVLPHLDWMTAVLEA